LHSAIYISKQAFMQISGIDHVVIKVADLDRSIWFYCRILGCTLEWRRDEIALAHLRVGNSFIDLLASPPIPSDFVRNMDHFCLTVADFDLERVRTHLQDHGIAVGEATERFGASGWGQSLYLADPDDNDLELRG
jgi:glyoxylase I family protein